MQHRPSGLVAAKTQNTLQAQSADAVLLARDLPHGPEPDRQRQMAVLKNGARRDRHLIPALVAAPAIPPNRPSLGSGAPRTQPSSRPTKTSEVRGARLIAAKAPLQLQQSSRIVLVHDPKTLPVGGGGVK